jgi:hypothetical protein
MISNVLGPVFAWIILHLFSIALLLWGFERSLNIANRKRDVSPLGAGPETEVVEEVVRHLRMAKGWHLRGTVDDCLPVALTAAFLLNRRQAEARLMLGVALHPFRAHAWVVVRNKVIDFPPDKHKEYVPIDMSAESRVFPSGASEDPRVC